MSENTENVTNSIVMSSNACLFQLSAKPQRYYIINNYFYTENNNTNNSCEFHSISKIEGLSKQFEINFFLTTRWLVKL